MNEFKKVNRNSNNSCTNLGVVELETSLADETPFHFFAELTAEGVFNGALACFFAHECACFTTVALLA